MSISIPYSNMDTSNVIAGTAIPTPVLGQALSHWAHQVDVHHTYDDHG